MSNLSTSVFQNSNIRFEDRNGRVWVNLTDMAKASGKRIGDWNRLESTKQFLTGFSESMVIPIDQILVSNESQGTNEQRGTWAIEDVAIKFAAWCSIPFEIWMIQQIKTLMSEGSVSLETKQTPQTYIEALKALVAVEEEKERLKKEAELMELEKKELESENERQSEIIDELFDYSSIIRVAKFNKVSEKLFSWRRLKSVSVKMGLEIKKAPCPRYGEKNLYHHDVWRYAYENYKLPETTTLVIQN
jgi:hypothetical protein